MLHLPDLKEQVSAQSTHSLPPPTRILAWS